MWHGCVSRGVERGFTLIEVLVAMALVALSVLGSARLVVAGVELEDRARRLQRAAEAIDRMAIEVPPDGDWIEIEDVDGRGVGCRGRSTPAHAGIAWRWIQADCGDRRLQDDMRPVGRVLLVPD